MPQNSPLRVGPIAIPSTGAYANNLYNPAPISGGVNASAAPYDKTYAIVRKIRVMNKSAGAVTFRLYLGASGANAAGTELFYDRSVPANSEIYEPCYLRMGTGDFLVGGASAGTSLVLQLEGEVGVGA